MPYSGYILAQHIHVLCCMWHGGVESQLSVAWRMAKRKQKSVQNNEAKHKNQNKNV